MLYYNYSKLRIMASSLKPSSSNLFFELTSRIIFANGRYVYATEDEGVTVTNKGDAGSGRVIVGGHCYGTSSIAYFITDTGHYGLYTWNAGGLGLDLFVMMPGALGGTGIDIQRIGTKIWWMCVRDNAGNRYIDFGNQTDGMPLHSNNMGAIGALTSTYSLFFYESVSATFYFLFKWSSGNVHLWRYVPATGVFTDLIDCGASTSIPSSLSQQGLAYDGSDIIYFILNDSVDNHLYTYSISGVSITKSGELNVGLQLDRNVIGTAIPFTLEKAFSITDDKVYQISASKGNYNWISNQDFDDVLISVSDTYLVDNSATLYKYQDMSQYITMCQIQHDVRNYPSCKIQFRSDYITLVDGLFVQIFAMYSGTGASTDNLVIFEGNVKNYSLSKLREAYLENRSSELFKITISGTYTGDTDGNLHTMIDAECDYVTVGTLSDGAALSVNPTYQEKVLGQIAMEYCDIDSYCWYEKPQGAFNYDNGAVDTGADIRYDGSGNLDNILQIQGFHPSKRINRVEVSGAWNPTTGIPYSGSVDNLADQALNGKVKLVIQDSNLHADADCTTKATTILNREIATPTLIQFSYRKTTVGFCQPGQQITFKFTSNEITIAEAQYTIYKITYNAKSDIGYIEAMSGLLFDSSQSMSPEQQNAEMIQQVGDVLITTKATADAAAPDADLTTHENLTTTAHGGSLCRITTGTYIGNNGGNVANWTGVQQIKPAVCSGITPKMVKVWYNAVGAEFEAEHTPDMVTNYCSYQQGGVGGMTSFRLRIIEGGFEANDYGSNYHPNVDGWAYCYIIWF